MWTLRATMHNSSPCAAQVRGVANRVHSIISHSHNHHAVTGTVLNPLPSLAVASAAASQSHPPFTRSFAYRPDPTPNEKARVELEAMKSRRQAAASALPSADPSISPHIRAQSTTVSDVLNTFGSDGKTFTCLASQPLYAAVEIMVSSRVGCLVAMEDDGEHVAGLVTERDILSEMVRIQSNRNETAQGKAAATTTAAANDTSSTNLDDWRQLTVSQAMTGSREMVHIKPTDRIDDALALMTSQGFRHLPVLDTSNGVNHLRGIVSMRNLVDTVYKNQAAGGKAQFLTDVLPRTGVPKNTSLRKKVSDPAVASSHRSLYLNSSVSAIPHPDKAHGEDSYVSFLGRIAVPSKDGSSITSSGPLSVIAVFDGVGSWSFEIGIDPSKFSNECARALKQTVESHPYVQKGSDATTDAKATDPTATDTPVKSAPIAPLTPISLMDAAWRSVTHEKIVGSSTACILALAHDSNDLQASNIGDSGFLILRHRNAHVRVGSVGLMNDVNPGTPWQVIFRSPQQLHYFNCPLQLGISQAGETDKYETPLDAHTFTTPVQEGDLIVLATDGLFDNVPEETIVQTINEEMEKLSQANSLTSTSNIPYHSIINPVKVSKSSSSSSSSSPSSSSPSATSSPMQPVADSLVKVALGLSVDRTIDSPFAVLAKENNILWYGKRDIPRECSTDPPAYLLTLCLPVLLVSSC